MEKALFFMGIVILFATVQASFDSGKNVTKPEEVRNVGDVIIFEQGVKYRVASLDVIKDGFAKYKKFTAVDLTSQTSPPSFTFTDRCRGKCWDPAIGQKLKGKYKKVPIKWNMQVTPRHRDAVPFDVELIKACTCQKRRKGKGRKKPKSTTISPPTST